MKNLAALCVFMATMGQLSSASPPSLINYQGKLLNTNGTPVNGSVSVQVDLFTAASGGSPVYTENIGSVAVVDGIYSLNFGQAGQSVSQITETLGVGNGSQQIFTKTVNSPPMINPSVTITDGAYTWTDVSGSSNPAQFSGTAIHASGFVAATYLSVPPANGTTITVSYASSSSTIDAALHVETSSWLQITVDGTPLTPRHRLASAPFAIVAADAERLGGYLPSDFMLTGSNAASASSSHELSDVVMWTYLDDTARSFDNYHRDAMPAGVLTEVFTTTNGLYGLVSHADRFQNRYTDKVGGPGYTAYTTNNNTTEFRYAGSHPLKTNYVGVVNANMFPGCSMYCVFHYTSGNVSTSSMFTFGCGSLNGITINNPSPDRVATHLDVYLRSDNTNCPGWYTFAQLQIREAGYLYPEVNVALVLPVKTNVSKILVHPRALTLGDTVVVYHSAANGVWSSNQPINSVNTLASSVSPTGLVISMKTSTTNLLSAEGSELRAVGVKVW